jgi:hypothetical protein
LEHLSLDSACPNQIADGVFQLFQALAGGATKPNGSQGKEDAFFPLAREIAFVLNEHAFPALELGQQHFVARRERF